MYIRSERAHRLIGSISGKRIEEILDFKNSLETEGISLRRLYFGQRLRPGAHP
jgi:hypothetical protein